MWATFDHPNCDRAGSQKDVLVLKKILHGVNFSFTNQHVESQVWFHSHPSKAWAVFQRELKMNSCYEGVNETHNANIHDDPLFAAIVAREQTNDKDALSTTEKNNFKCEIMIEGC